MALLARVRIAAGLAAASVLMAACAQTHATPAPTSTTPSTPLSARPSHHDVLAAVNTLNLYLQAWATQGPMRASRYLVPGQRVSRDRGVPHISAGTIRSHHLYSWSGSKQFTLVVSLDLTFTNDPMGWNRGINDRFVTAHRTGKSDGYLLEFATSP